MLYGLVCLKKKVKKPDLATSYRASIDRIDSLSVQVAPIEDQRKAMEEIKTYEAHLDDLLNSVSPKWEKEYLIKNSNHRR